MPYEVEVFLTKILPASVASGLVLFGLWRWRRAAWPAAIAVTVGFVVGRVLALGAAPEPWPVDSTRLVIHFALLALLLRLVAVKLPAGAAIAGRAVVSLAVPYLLLRTLAEPPWQTPVQHAPWFGAFGAILFASWWLLEWRGERLRGPSIPVALIVAATGGSLALVQAHSAGLGQAAALVAGVLGPVALVGFLARDTRAGIGAASVAGLLLPVLWLAGLFFGDELPMASALLLTVAPLFAFRNWWLSGILAAIPTAVAFYLAVQANPPSPYGY
jgi:hypothetical protein